MIEELLLQQRLDAVREAQREVRRRRAVVVPLLAGALAAGGLALAGGRGLTQALWILPLLTAGWVLIRRWWAGRRAAADVEVAREIEAAEPELDARLITAVGIMERANAAAKEPGYLERRVISETLNAGDAEGWVEKVVGNRLKRAVLWGNVALYLFLACVVWLAVTLREDLLPTLVAQVPEVEKDAPVPADVMLEFAVKPGAVEVELDAQLVVEAKISPRVPKEAWLVWADLSGVELGRAVMPLGVDAETFGGMIPRVARDLRYRVEAEGQRSAEFAVETFVYPKLERLDVVIAPPAYTGLPEREIKNTLKVAAPEGSTLIFKARVNKPVAEAELFASEDQIIKLTPGAEGAQVLEGTLLLEKSGKYRLHLVDEKERGNVKPPWVVLTAQPNALAKIEVVFPKRDLQVSALQELPVEARVWDDVSVKRSGAVVTLAGTTREVVFDHEVTGPNQKQLVKEMLNLEGEGVLPRQLVSYHFWAEDAGPKGEVRRAMSDMFFAQVRHFEDIFRETEAPPSEPGMPGEKKAGKLVELQKQVVNANWRVVRDTAAGKAMDAAVKDVAVVRESQGIALEQTKAEMEEAEDAEVKSALTEAWKAMREALEALEKAEQEKQRTALNQAQEHEQAALQWLYQASEREHLVARQDPNQKSQGGSPQDKDEQLMNLELKQEEQRYEQEKTAQEEQTAQQKESLEVLNKLKELARRQEALAKKMQELREQMAKASSEAEKQELNDQLKRLQEEQEELLRGLDDLNENLAQSERAPDMEETRKELEEVREQALEAAEELKNSNLADAANAATRAERDLKALEEDFREKSARRFSEEMKQMKQDAQAVAQAQEKITEALENQKTPEGAERGDTSNALERMLSGSEVAKELAAQQERVEKLMEQMKAVSEQAEGAEPILSRKLYEAVRGAQTSGLEESLEEARMRSRYGDRAGTQEAERKAAASVENLAKGIEAAAETVLGSEAEALRMARNELDRLIEDVEKEVADASGGEPAGGEKGEAKAGKSPQGEMAEANQGKPGEQGEKGEGGKVPSKDGQGKGESQEPGEGKGAGQEAKTAQGQDKGEGKEPGQGTGQGTEPGQGKGQMAQSGEAGAEGQGQGQGKGEAASQQGRGEAAQSGQPGGQQAAGGGRTGESGERQAGGSVAGGNSRSGGSNAGGWFFDETAEAPREGPFTGEGYRQWSERLSMVEELLADPELANEAAKVADDARALKLDHSRNNEAPQAATLQARITMPLLELRNRVLEELARKGAQNPNVPIDRDPVPPAFRDLVRRYYTELGEGD